ncbi:hypothetical protein [Flavobacterium sp.]|uniref:hypothetical protein n=1 Tax=Flavobacterium sp. TaxID=239 RepID=UPI00261B3F55|nr:hypothetical protein [Flavobacterium sp.]
MKRNFKTIGLLFFGIMTMTSCSTDSIVEEITNYAPSASEWNDVREAALENQTQTFTATAGTGMINLTSSHGVQISLNGNDLTKNGNPVTGSIDIKFIELFDKGTMLVTNKPTMGVMPDGNKSILISGGEFYINATQGGVQLAITSNIQLDVPNNLTTPLIDTGMTFWAGNVADEDNLAWEKPAAAPVDHGGAVGFTQSSYNVSFGNFGWTNIDRFYSDPRPKTQILATVPFGYNNTNSAVYLSVDGEGQNQLAKFDTYNATTQQFSEHYGQIPIGLQCHLIFATEDNGQWRYAIKSVTTTANAVYAFTLSETVVGSEAQMIAAINAIQ